MREYKFRAWGESIGWLYITGFETAETKVSKGYTLDGVFHDGDFIGKDEVTYMQYTGLKDKNGKEIYEGDIIEYNDNSYGRTGGHIDDRIMKSVVKFEYGAFWLGGLLLIDAISNDEELEIVGNIYDNPDLLGGVGE